MLVFTLKKKRFKKCDSQGSALDKGKKNSQSTYNWGIGLVNDELAHVRA